MSYKNQYHVFNNVSLGTNAFTTQAVPAYVAFKVKKIKFDFAYTILASSPPNYIITSSVSNNDIVGVMNKFSTAGDISLQISTANFDAANATGANPSVLPANLPITVGNNSYFGNNIVAYISPAQWTAANINGTVNPVTAGANLSGTISGNFTNISITQANFNAANIVGGGATLTLPAALDVDLDDSNLVWSIDGFSEDKCMSYVFRDPIDINGYINFSFNNLNSANCNVVLANVVVHMEFLGE
jgi:hypothetical protein